MVLFFLFVLIPISAKAEIIIERPNQFVDTKGTIRPGDAIDTNLSSYAQISAVPNAYPYIAYSWDSDENYDSVFLNLRVYSEYFTNDKWGIKYSLDGGTNWVILKEMSSENIVSHLDIRENIGSLNLSNLQIRFDTDSKGKVDGGIINIYDIFAEATISGLSEPILYQSSYRFFESIGLNDFYSINSGVAGVDEARAIATDGTYMYVAGFQPGGWRIEKRSLLNGALVNSESNECAGEPHTIIAENGFIYIVGDDYTEGNYQWRIEKRHTGDLALDTNFDGDGIVLSNPSEGDDTAYDMAIVGPSIYVVGSDRTHGDSQWRMEVRSKVDGLFVSGDGGTILSNPSNANDIPYAIAHAIVGGEGYLYIGGYDRIPKISTKPGKDKKATSNAQWRLEKRPLTDPSQVQIMQFNPTGNFDTIKDIAVDDNFIYLVGYQEEGFFDTAWRTEKRNLSDLELDTGFGTAGLIIIDPGYHDSPESIALDSEYIYIVGFSADVGGGGDTAWRIEKWGKDNGDEVYSIVNDIDSDYNDRAYGIAIDGGFMYTVGYEQPYLADWRIEKRDIGTGFLLEPLSEQNNSVNLQVNDEFRLKILVHVDENALPLAQGVFKLQVAEIGTANGECSAELAYSDVVHTGSGINFNAILGTDGSAVKITEEDPYNEGELTRYQSYEESNNFVNGESEVLAGENGLWDFSLTANALGSFCFRSRIKNIE